MTTNEILKVKDLLNRANCIGRECKKCPYYDTNECINKADTHFLRKYVYELKDEINLQKAKIEALQMDNKQLQSDVITVNQNYEHIKELRETTIESARRINIRFVKTRAELKETQEKLEVLLCEVTGGKLSKHSYTAEVMTTQAHEHLLKCCEDERAEAVKEFADRLKEELASTLGCPITDTLQIIINNLVKEMAGES